MPENKIYTFFRKFVIALILLFTFLLPLKLGGIVGVPEATGLFTDELAAYLIITWPVFLFPFISGILLLLALMAFPFKTVSFDKDKTFIIAFLWVFLAFASLLGAVNATVWDFVIMEVTHIFGVVAYILAVYLLLKNVPKARTMLIASMLAGLIMTVYLGLEQYFVGFAEMREYILEQEKSGIVGGGGLRSRIFDDRVHMPFSGCNSLAGYLLLTIPLCLVTLWKLCAKVEPPKTARLIFIPIVAACLFFVFFVTKARGAFLSLILAGGVFIVFFPVKKWLRWSIIIAVPLVFIVGMLYIYKFGRGFDSMKVRVDYIWVSIKLLFKHPFAGTGWGDFFYDYMKIKTIQSKEAPHTPHNLFLALGGQAGILAMLASIGALFYPLWLGAKKVRSLIAEHNYMQEDVALLFGLIAFLFHAMMDIDLQVPALIATAGAITLLLAIPAENKNENSKPVRRISACFVALVVAAVAIVGGWHLISSEYVFSKLTDTCELRKKTPEQIANINPDEVYGKLEAALKARPYSPFPYSSAGAFYMGTRRLERAEFCYKEALKLAPNCAAYYFRLFSIQDLQGRSEEAKKNLLKACELFPNNPKYKLVKDAFIKK
jgi:O-Antigen ligase/Tetratricopeptide repeat